MTGRRSAVGAGRFGVTEWDHETRSDYEPAAWPADRCRCCGGPVDPATACPNCSTPGVVS